MAEFSLNNDVFTSHEETEKCHSRECIEHTNNHIPVSLGDDVFHLENGTKVDTLKLTTREKAQLLLSKSTSSVESDGVDSTEKTTEYGDEDFLIDAASAMSTENKDD